MNIIEKVLSLVWQKGKQKRGVGLTASDFAPMPLPPRRSGVAWLQMYSEQPWLHSTVKLMAESIASAPIHLYTSKRAKDNEIKDHPALKLLAKPNSLMSGYRMMVLSVIWKKMNGECFWIRDNNALGLPAALWPIPPHWVTMTPYQGWPFYRVYIGFQAWTIPEEEILWFKDDDPIDPYGRGIGDAFAAVNDIETDGFASQWNRNFFANGARPDFVIQAKNEVQPEDADFLREQWAIRHRGFWNAFKPALLDNGAEIKELTRSHKDMDFKILRDNTRDNTLGAFHTPRTMLGITENVNRANAEAGEYIYGKWSVHPELKYWKADFDSQYFSIWDESLYCGYDSPIPEDSDRKRAEANDGLERGAVTVNEYRQKMGYDTRPDGDMLLVPYHSVPVKDLGNMPAVLAPVPTAYHEPSAAPAKSYKADGDVFNKAWSARELSLKNQVQKYFSAQEREVKGNIRNGAQQPFDCEAWDEHAVVYLKPEMETTFHAAGIQGSSEVGGTFSMQDPGAKKFAAQGLMAHWKGDHSINRTTYDALVKALKEGLAAGLSVDELITRIEAVYELAKESRAGTIACTETQYATNMGLLQAYNQAGQDKNIKKYWSSKGDEKVRETHAAANIDYSKDKAIGLFEKFKVGAGYCICPGHTGIAEEDINCRCRVKAVVIT